MTTSPPSPELTPDERAAARAFVARCEVRLSTLHRIAVGMLSGAGLLVVLPVVARDSVTGLLRSLLIGGVDAADVSLIVAGSVWLAAIALVWAPLVVLAVTSPVRWIERLMRDDGAPSTAVADDPELTHVERVSLRIAAVGWIGAATAMLLSVTGDASTSARTVGLIVLTASALAVAMAASNGRFRALASIRA